jgi:hypothetical protein
MNQVIKRVIQGTYADFKVVKTRKVLQMIIEIPIERSDDFTKKFGLPDPSKEKWVAVAYLNDATPPQQDSDASKVVQISGILCRTPKFGEFLNQKFNAKVDVSDPDSIANMLRTVCSVSSRADFATNLVAQKSFVDLHTEYRKWLEK